MSGNYAYATTPFDHAKADIIFRSSDNVDFRVFKLFLSLASPFFETLFEIPQPATGNKGQEVRDGLLVISVTEDSKTLDALFRFCYPCTLVDDPKIEVLKDALDVLEAAKKYSLDAIEKKARLAILNPKILDAEPVRCFAIAHRGRLREETLLAAKYTLAQSPIPPQFKEIDLITASDFLSLLTYHQKCGDAVYALRLDLWWIRSHYLATGLYDSKRACGCPTAQKPKYSMLLNRSQTSPQWWEDFMEDTFVALRDKPCIATVHVSMHKMMRGTQVQNCVACGSRVAGGMVDLVDLFARKIEETVSRVKLELSF